ncbi:hypothetical protein F4859DRAFT_528845 [Xylaria cf. heliscus]|nr:hypothetical protein F4859DRAFT_528845 [Xylaria cf. heliscus]
MAKTKRVTQPRLKEQRTAKGTSKRPHTKVSAPKVSLDNVSENGRAPGVEDVKAKESTLDPLKVESRPGKKRKRSKEENTQPTKAPRDGTRRSSRDGGKTQPTQLQLLNYLMSKEAEELCRPDDEKEYLQDHGKATTYGSMNLNPYEELISAVILSRRVSHRLGLRSIRTLLNSPYDFSSAKKTQVAGPEKQHQAFRDAKTRYTEKTAREVGEVAAVVLEKYSAEGDEDGAELNRLKQSNSDIDGLLNTLKSDIKGFGNTTKDIFHRRIQRLWDDAYPYIDKKAGEDLKALGLPDHADELEDAIDSNWKHLETKALVGGNEPAKKRTAFATILERAIDAQLEGKLNEVIIAAAASA